MIDGDWIEPYFDKGMEEDSSNSINYRQSKMHVQGFSKTFAVFLCIYFCFIFIRCINGIPQYFKHLIPEISQSDHPASYALIYGISFLWTLYGIWAIILSLKKSDYAIKCLKLCLPYHFIAFAFATLPKVTSITFGTLWLPVFIIFFPLIFFIYICASRDIKDLFPVEQRRLGLPGVTGILLYVLLLLTFGQAAIASLASSINSRKTTLDRIELSDNELTDGRIVFSPIDTWVHDSTAVLNTTQDAFYFHDSNTGAQICVVGATEEYKPSRHFYIYSITENQPLETKYYSEELNHKTLSCDDYITYIDQYKYQIDSTDFYWTYASRIGKRCSKAVRISILEKGMQNFSVQDAINFLNGASIDLKDRLFKKNRIHKKDNGNSTDEINNPTKSVTEQQ